MRSSSSSSEMASAKISCSDRSLKFLAMSLDAQSQHASGGGIALMDGRLDLVLTRSGLNGAHKRDGAGLIGGRKLGRCARDHFPILLNFNRQPRRTRARNRIDHQEERDFALGRI